MDRGGALRPSRAAQAVQHVPPDAASLVDRIPGASVLCSACAEQLAGSAFLADLDAGGDTEPGVRYTVIETRFDEVVTPFTSAFLSGAEVTNVVLQDSCPQDHSGHLGVVFDPNAVGWVLHALDPAVPPPACVPFDLPI